jgi:ankyrin repeat protein
MKKLLYIVTLATACNIWAADPDQLKKEDEDKWEETKQEMRGHGLVIWERGGKFKVNTSPDAFYRAVESAETRVVSTLLNMQNINPQLLVNMQSKEGWTPLMQATTNCDEEMVKLLLQHKADVNISRPNGMTALLQAFMQYAPCKKENRIKIINMLLDQPNININVKTDSGITPLMYAAADGYTAIVQRLLEMGADPTPQDKYKRTAVDFALSKEHEEIAELIKNST